MLQEPKHQPLSHTDPVFRERCASLRRMTMLCAQVKIKAKPVALGDATREATYSGGFGSWSHSFSSWHGSASVHPTLSLHADSLFWGLSSFNPTWKGKSGTSQPAQSSRFFWLKINRLFLSS